MTPLTALVSFGVSGIYLSFLMVVVAAEVAWLRGWKAEGPFKLWIWAWPVLIGALVYGALMLANVLIPTGDHQSQGRALQFRLAELTVMVFICLIGAIYFLAATLTRDRPR